MNLAPSVNVPEQWGKFEGVRKLKNRVEPAKTSSPHTLSLNILVRGWDKGVVQASTQDSILDLKFEIFEHTGILPSKQYIALNNIALDLHQKVGDVGLEDG